MFNLFTRKKSNRQVRPLVAMQIEVSSRCNLKCSFCPCTYSEDKGDFLPLQLFKRLSPYFSRARWVYLQGWGEPLLNPHLWEMAEMAKSKGCKVGFTTNGSMLTDENIAKIFATGIDLISLSIAGATQETHGKLRRGSNLAVLVNQLLKIAHLKRKNGTKTPRVHLSYMLTKESIKELEAGLSLAVQVAADAIYSTNLDYVFQRRVNQEKVFSWSSSPPKEYKEIITRGLEFAQRNNLPFKTYPLYTEAEQAVCDLNPQHYVFITSRGNVVPCTYLSRDDKVRIFRDNEYENNHLFFGNIQSEDFAQIWDKKEYRDFRKPFDLRNKAYQELILSLTTQEVSLSRLKEGDEKYAKVLLNNPLPDPCQKCPKKYGI